MFLYYIQDPDGKIWNETASLDTNHGHESAYHARNGCMVKFVKSWLSRLDNIDYYFASQVWNKFKDCGWEMVKIDMTNPDSIECTTERKF